MLTWRLNDLMDQRGIATGTQLRNLLRERGVRLSRQGIHRLIHHDPKRLSLSLLSALCAALTCTPNELFSIAQRESPAASGPQPPHFVIGRAKDVRKL